MNRVSSLAINAADHLVSKGRLDAAASILRNYLSANAAMPEILQRLGRILLAQGRSAEAIVLLETALNQFKESEQIAADTETQSHDVEISSNTISAASKIPTCEVPHVTMEADRS